MRAILLKIIRNRLKQKRDGKSTQSMTYSVENGHHLIIGQRLRETSKLLVGDTRFCHEMRYTCKIDMGRGRIYKSMQEVYFCLLFLSCIKDM